MAINDTKMLILANAGSRDDFKVLPLPKGLRVNSATVTKTLKSMLGAGLLAEVAALASDTSWRRGEAGGGLTLVATAEGLRAVGIETEKSTAARPAKTRKSGNEVPRTKSRAHKPLTGPKGGGTSRTRKVANPAPSGRAAATKPTKQEIVVGMLRRANGASIDELAQATGWQPHSVRGVLTATIKGRLGLTLSSEKGSDGVRRYFVASPAARKGKRS